MKTRSLLIIAAILSLAGFVVSFALPLLIVSLGLWFGLFAQHAYAAPKPLSVARPARKAAWPLAA